MKVNIWTLAMLLIVVALPAPGFAAAAPLVTEFTPVGSDPSCYERFGAAADASLDTLVVGAPSDEGDGATGRGVAKGNVSVYANKETGWELVQQITPGSGSSNMGAHVAVDGDRMAISQTSPTRVLTMYERRDGLWVYTQDLPFPTSYLEGKGIDLHAGVLAIGLPDTNSGTQSKVLIYELFGQTWVLTATLRPPVDEPYFGKRVAVDRNNVLVGTFAGEVYTFRRGPAGWAASQPLPSLGRWDEGLAIHNGTAIVGAPWDGLVATFRDTGSMWQPVGVISGPEPDTDTGIQSGFGYDVAASDDGLAVAAPRTAGGVTYVYDWLAPGAPAPVPQRLQAKGPGLGPLNDFGLTVMFAEDHVLVPAQWDGSAGIRRAGVVYAFKPTVDGWKQFQKIMPTEGDGSCRAYFGDRVTWTDAGELVVGQPGTEEIQVLDPQGVSPRATLSRNPHVQADCPNLSEHCWGVELDSSGERIVVADDPMFSSVCSVRCSIDIFHRTETGWAKEATLPNPEPTLYEPTQVSIDGTRMVAVWEGYDYYDHAFLKVYSLVNGSWVIDESVDTESGWANDVLLWGDWIIVALPGWTNVYHFDGTVWSRAHYIDVPARDIAFDGSTLLLSQNDGGGKVHFYRFTGEPFVPWETFAPWQQVNVLAGDVEIQGDRAFVASRDASSGFANAVLTFQTDGNDWSEVGRITHPVADVGFGSDIAVRGNLVAIGAPFHSSTGRQAGSVFLYDLALPDLTAGSLLLSQPAPIEGDLVTITATITNLGTANAAGSTAEILVDGIVVGTRTLGALAPQETALVQVEWTAVEGSHEVRVVADVYDSIAETEESNNEASLVVEVGPRPAFGVDLSPPDQRQNVKAKGTATYTITVTNTGTATDTIDLSLAGSKPGWSASISKPSVTLAAGASTTVQVMVKAANGGEFAVTVTGTSRADPSAKDTASCITRVGK